MKRFLYLALLMAISSSADAGNSLSFVVGGHRIRIEAPSHCRSSSCVSVSIPGIYQSRRWRDRFDDDDRDLAVQAKAPAAAPSPAQAVPPQGNPPVAVAPPSVGFKPAAATIQEVAAPPPAVAMPKLPPPPPAPAPTMNAPAEKPAEAVRVSHDVEDDPADLPIGDWRSEENKGKVRIERCGRALCGYAFNASTDEKGEAVLVNMKPKTEQQWTGNVVSRDGGGTYYGTMAVKGPNELRVEACAVSRFYCTGNVWTRVDAKPERLITSRQASPEPRS